MGRVAGMRRGWSLLVAAVLVVAVPAGLLVWLRSETSERLSGLEPEPVPVVVAVESREVSDRRAVTVVPVWGEAPVVVAPGWFGTVTSVAVEAGRVVSSGDEVVGIDGVARVALTTPEPFWRRLGRRDVGRDVAMLEAWLVEAGFFEGEVDGLFGRDLTRAVKAWSETLGVVKPDGVFDPGWVVWLPEDGFVVAETPLRVGAPAPGAGSPVLVGATPLVEVSLRDQEDRRFAEEGEWVLEVGDVEVAVVDAAVTDEGLETLGSVLDPAQEFVSGRIRRAEPLAVLEIPATAVVADAEGATCVFVPDGDGFVARGVVLGGGRVSRVDVADGLEPGDEVLVNPQDVFDAPSCP